jgi:hypothetical protein
VVVEAGQAPAPLHTAAFVWVPALQLAVRQTVSLPGILHVALVPSQVPAQAPVPPQAGWPVLGVPEAKPQVPGVVPLQNSQEPVQVVLQHTPSAQLPVTHCVAAVHA